MIRLTEEQACALNSERPPTGQVYRLIKQEVYDILSGAFKSKAWGTDDDGDENLIRERKP